MSLFSGFSNIPRIPELRNRVLFSLGVLVVYRLGVFITIPGVDRTVMQALVGSTGGIVQMLNMFSGGALENLSIFALGIMPYA
jgi:preprotein translocase subunit SecY